jgi:hypothetical protein
MSLQSERSKTADLFESKSGIFGLKAVFFGKKKGKERRFFLPVSEQITIARY